MTTYFGRIKYVSIYSFHIILFVLLMDVQYIDYIRSFTYLFGILGYHSQKNVSFQSNAYSRTIYGMQLRKGCDQVAGSGEKMDRCGICGGNGKRCVKCDGQAESGKFT